MDSATTWRAKRILSPAARMSTVSEVRGIHYYPENALKPAPATLSKSRQSFTAGVLSWKQRHIGVLDHELLFYALAKGLE